MAKKDTRSTDPASGSTNVRRIRATESAKPEKKQTAKTTKDAPTVAAAETAGTGKRRNPFKATRDYFTGAWYEIKQVRWPTRKATWSMTGALLAFTAFFVIIILLLDSLFKYIFQLILG